MDRSALAMVHWTIAFAYGETGLTRIMEKLFNPVPFEAVAKRDDDRDNGSTDKGGAQ